MQKESVLSNTENLPVKKPEKEFYPGEYVVYQTVGVCRVEDKTTLNMAGVPKDRLYYILCPDSQKGGTLFVPVGNEEKHHMRRVLSRQEAEKLLDEMPDLEEIPIKNDKTREEIYKNAVKSCQCREWVRIIKTLYRRKQERISQGRKITVMDDKYLKKAEDNLYAELALAFDIPKDQVVDYIREKLDEENMGD